MILLVYPSRDQIVLCVIHDTKISLTPGIKQWGKNGKYILILYVITFENQKHSGDSLCCSKSPTGELHCSQNLSKPTFVMERLPPSHQFLCCYQYTLYPDAIHPPVNL